MQDGKTITGDIRKLKKKQTPTVQRTHYKNSALNNLTLLPINRF